MFFAALAKEMNIVYLQTSQFTGVDKVEAHSQICSPRAQKQQTIVIKHHHYQ